LSGLYHQKNETKLLPKFYRSGLNREKLRQAIIEGCQAMADLHLDIEQEYHSLEEEAYIKKSLGIGATYT
jgi:hypothetical protein